MEVFDFSAVDSSALAERSKPSRHSAENRNFFNTCKRAFDIGMCILLIPFFLTVAAALVLLNPWLNSGPLFFVQKRMGRHCEPFGAIKFRSMSEAEVIERSPECPLEVHRITVLGRFIRRIRIDELPQILNVLRGEMSLIGPRPDCYEHAEHYLREVPGYRYRHSVRPGISGLAQTEVGYVEGSNATRRKVSADLYYISHTGFLMEAWLVWRTLAVILGRQGN
ncbi:sugar transferase [Pseudoruegeria sp. HB172150]|uniref:sugar transferase n=1 Tax=Pseudoruegeria sp. HB172150 TaxID=2721164 RepID=UPI001557A41C|nr:sugar transferase [Pseudoruegeria sp. HB172150]